ncbi:hypothetical protein [Micromonospora costi]|uniref:hypothetical protein n=1 Tax=Micromonospora costi TaxID=1530042 RepID=UPI00157568BE
MPTTARRRVPLVAGLGLTVALVVAAIAPATAALRVGPGAECPPEQHDCSVWDDDPGTPGGPGGGGDNGDGGDSGGGGGTAKCQWNGRPVKCYDDLLGWFDNGTGCYAKPLESPPTPAPEGKEWYLLTCNGGDLGAQRPELLDGPPPGYGAPPDPEELARRALASIRLLPPRIAVAPRRANGPGLVGLPVWMWAQRDPDDGAKNYFGPLHARASDRGLTVSIEAKVDRVLWNMGNGETVPCDGPGTPYTVNGPYAGKPSPDCGYDSGYAKAGTYTVSATTHWTVRWWTGDGVEGDPITQTRTSGTASIQINELQVVTR